MSVNYMRLLCLMACCISASLASYRQADYSAPSYGSVGDYVKNAETAEAQAAALTNSAGAAASSAKLDGTDWYALNRYGWEQGKPLLVKPYGPLDKLYAAALPPRSFVAEIDPVFKRNNYGGAYGEKTITLNTGSKLAVSAV
ncbi:chorion protein S16 [Drosophila innubila]|uniref:chorion protein S16 n=1 Tax=Drosophila innubila TaxID=198719 RepID=UPI00148CB1A3|nr:chorion protein S16 [Drosophila innubila]